MRRRPEAPTPCRRRSRNPASAEQALEYTLAANPLVGIREQEIWDFSGKLFEQIAINPTLAAKHYMSYIGELGRIVSGDCALAPDARDKRVADRGAMRQKRKSE
ncbi:hypothetical protein J6524_05505 [Bradyrhizobium sp. WSM 1738]|uniref:hypothetical protein n=1 Tax=Bradyrhizobium hereditatis TaxID=2821405 RepID=UPI001CE2E110|nr:hypothetical protein [Bradyrhizobium hereditatis]MCA6114380.1 hypothetical protein [Bradyrhizobium hereditatis]